MHGWTDGDSKCMNEWMDKHKVCWCRSVQMGRATCKLRHRDVSHWGPQCDNLLGPRALCAPISLTLTPPHTPPEPETHPGKAIQCQRHV